MIVAIGVDTIKIARFKDWHSYKRNKLCRIFSPEEVKYCLQIHTKSCERFAVRFAAREALYKALSGIGLQKPVPFLRLCRLTQITSRKKTAPDINVDWKTLLPDQMNLVKNIRIHISLSHSQTDACAFIILEKTTQ